MKIKVLASDIEAANEWRSNRVMTSGDSIPNHCPVAQAVKRELAANKIPFVRISAFSDIIRVEGYNKLGMKVTKHLKEPTQPIKNFMYKWDGSEEVGELSFLVEQRRIDDIVLEFSKSDPRNWPQE